MNDTYKIQIWKDKWISASGDVPAHWGEERGAEIGGSDLTFEGRARNVKFSKSSSGEINFSFELPRVFVNAQGVSEENYLIQYLPNEAKIKLFFKDEWYDFIIKGQD
jgi:hypothetical protein